MGDKAQVFTKFEMGFFGVLENRPSGATLTHNILGFDSQHRGVDLTALLLESS